MMTNEESINGVMQTATQGSRGAFFFLRWLFHRLEKTKIERSQREADRLMTDACSRYRGGYYSPENQTLTEGLLSDLSRGRVEKSAPFIFLGDKSDLSIFWQVTEPERRALMRTIPDQRVVVPRKMLKEIPDETIRQRTLAAFTKAQADGLLLYDGRSYTITEAGKHYITKSDFVVRRLEAEYKFFTSAEIVLENDIADLKSAQKEDLINAELLKRGIDPEHYADCRRISINRQSLRAEQNGTDWLTFVPGSARKQKVIFPGENVIELNERTLIVFIDPNKQYVGIGEKRRLSGNDLMVLFTDKTSQQKRHPTVETIRKTATATPTAPQPISPAKLSIGDTIYAPDHFCNSLKLNEYKVQSVLVDTNGRNLYKLIGEGVSEQILPEDALDQFMFTDIAQGEAYISAHSKEAADYADTLLAQTMGEKFIAAEPEKAITYTLTLDKGNMITNYGDTCRVRLPGKQVEQVVLSTKDVLQQSEHLQITLHSDQSYKIITGAYGYSVSGEGLAQLSGATVQSASVMIDMPTQSASIPSLPKAGDTLYAPVSSPFGDVTIQEHKVVEQLTDASGNPIFKLENEYGKNHLIPESSLNEYFFTEPSKVDVYLKSHTGIAHDQHEYFWLYKVAEQNVVLTPTNATTGVAAQASAVTAATAAQSSVNAAVVALPIPEPITAAAKTLYAAASQTATTIAQTTVQTAQTTLKLTQSIGKEG